MLNRKLKTKDLVAVLQNKATHSPHKLAYLFLEDGVTETALITYGELDQKARTVAAYLQSKNLFGQRVLLLYPTGLDFIAAFMGCLYAGVIAVPVTCPKIEEFPKSQALINAIAQDAGISGVLTPQAYFESIEKYQVFVTDITTLSTEIAATYKTPEIYENTIAYLQYTSGSTATPKGVVVQHGSLIHDLKQGAKILHYTKNSVTLTWAPHAHVYGLICGLLLPLYHGSLAILMPPSAFINRPLCWLEAITKYHVSHSGCPNFGYELCLQTIQDHELAGLNLSRWKVAINGGENVQYETLLKFTEKFKPAGFKFKYFCPAYGMSELTGVITSKIPDKKPVTLSLATESLQNNDIVIADKNNRVLVSNGRLLPGLHAAIVEPQSLTLLPEGKIGEIWLTGKSVAGGYWQRSEETTEAFHATLANSQYKYFRTGDLGFIHHNEIFITGRLKEVIVVYGKKYYPADLENMVKNAATSLPIAANNAAFSASINNKEEIIFLQEVTEEITDTLANEIIKTIRGTISEQYGIDIYGVILVKKNSLPKTNSGKLQRRLCQQQFLDKKLAIIKEHFKANKSSLPPFENKSPLPPLFQRGEGGISSTELKKLISSILNINPNDINFNDPVSRYGFDSIKITKLTQALNEAYNLTLTPAILYQYKTLADFISDILEKTKSPPPPFEKEGLGGIYLQSGAAGISDPIAIIGMSAIFPGANDLDAFWQNLIEGKNAITEVPPERWQIENNSARWGGFIEDAAQFDADFFNISPREAEVTDPQQRLLLQTAWQAIEDAGYNTTKLAESKTGLFVAVSSSDYEELLYKNAITDAYVATGAMRSILANRISFLLNLQGPSMTVDTACSSSLVAIHNAVRAMQNGDCEAAVVGAVNMLLSPSLFLAATNAGMLSEDGSCKTFDQKANGYVRGEGIAAVLLKPLSKAQTDGDHIYAVIKGTAVNHGGHVSSLTVPNPNAQADVIIAACQRANITPDTISYIETHGTGTPLGDPIEINGLKKAFATAQTLPQHYCALGAVKTHIGHLEAAAGMAGLIKTVLAMQHAQIPGNLHFETLNPYIEIKDSPFYIADKNYPWNRLQSDIPRRAGISSFGFGGTNAHIIIEEYEIPQETENSYPCLITLSAKTDIALKHRLSNLYSWLKKQTQSLSLADISYTLNSGRNHFDKRCIMVVESITELQNTLEKIQQEQTPDNFIISNGAETKLKQRPIFDTAYKILLKEIQTPQQLTTAEYKDKLLALGDLYISGYELDWPQFYQGQKFNRISLPVYPFAKEHYWIPLKNIPYNIQKSHPLIEKNECTFDKQCFSKLFNGHEFYLRDHLVDGKKTLPGAVSIEMAYVTAKTISNERKVVGLSDIVWLHPIILENLEKKIFINFDKKETNTFFNISTINNNENTIHVEGKILYDQNPIIEQSKFDLNDLKKRFTHQKSNELIYNEFKEKRLDYGPSFQSIQYVMYSDKEALALLNLPSLLASNQNQWILHPSLIDGALQAIAYLIPFPKELLLPFSIKKLEVYNSLPTKIYAYIKTLGKYKFDVMLLDEKGSILINLYEVTLRPPTDPLKNFFYSPQWIEKTHVSKNKIEVDSVLIIYSEDSESIKLDISKLYSPHTRLILIKLGNSTERISENEWITKTEDTNSIDIIIKQIPQFEVIYFLSGITSLNLNILDLDIIENKKQQGIIFLFRLTKALITNGFEKKSLAFKTITNNSYSINQEKISPLSASLLGFCKSLAKECFNWKVTCIDIDLEEKANVKDIIEEPFSSNGSEVIFRKNRRYIRSLIKTNLPKTKLSFKKNGVYLIIGGTGGVGYLLSIYLAEKFNAKLIWIGRKPINDTIREQCTKITSKGGSALYLQGDITNLTSMEATLAQIKTQFGQINAAIHSALTLKDSSLARMTETDFRAALDPKLNGSLIFYKVLQQEPLDFMLFFSSAQSFAGNPGQSNYAAGSAFEDAFANHISKVSSYPVKVINWGYWGSIGVVATNFYRDRLAANGYYSIEPSHGIEAIERIIQTDITQILAINANESALKEIGLDDSYAINIYPLVIPSVLPSIIQSIEIPT